MANTDFAIEAEPLPGVFLLRTPRFEDARGVFLKGFHAEWFAANGLEFIPTEQFLTKSSANVLRGMHFQVGEHAHLKLVSCPIGRILDVVVDVRVDSPQFNQPIAIELGAANSHALLIGKGYAHGFLTLTNNSWVHYLTTAVHSPVNDKGVLWSSIAFDWPAAAPLVSDRDASHPSIGTEPCVFL
jgi:dTDP-4-dehydrorhamnose 3,5-epimerase